MAAIQQCSVYPDHNSHTRTGPDQPTGKPRGMYTHHDSHTQKSCRSSRAPYWYMVLSDHLLSEINPRSIISICHHAIFISIHFRSEIHENGTKSYILLFVYNQGCQCIQEFKRFQWLTLQEGIFVNICKIK